MTTHIERPVELANLVNPTEYQRIIQWAIENLQQKFENVAYNDGMLTCQDAAGQDYLISAVNMVKHVAALTESNAWETATNTYLDKFQTDQGLERFLYKDFEYAKERLIVRLCNQNMFSSQKMVGIPDIKDYHHRVDIPETYTILGLDLPDRIVLMSKDKTKDWEIDEATLFAIAFENIAEKLEVLETTMREIETDVNIITLFDNTYAAAYAIDFGENCANCEGDFGAIVCFPSKGSVFIHPIMNTEAFSKAFDWLLPIVNEFYQDDPGAITNNMYWYYEEKFVTFPRKTSKEGISYRIPKALFELLK